MMMLASAWKKSRLEETISEESNLEETILEEINGSKCEINEDKQDDDVSSGLGKSDDNDSANDSCNSSLSV